MNAGEYSITRIAIRALRESKIITEEEEKKFVELADSMTNADWDNDKTTSGLTEEE